MSTDLARLRNELSPLPVQQSALTASIQIAALDGNGTLAMPASIRHVLMEIGCSDRDTLDEQMLGTQEDGFLVSFEPQLDKFAVLLARGTTRAHGQRKDRSVQLGHHHDRGIVLPLAVSPHGGPMEFHVQHVSGCSSLLRLNPRATWAPWCNTAMEVRQVPSITLASALSLVPAHLPISFLKVDAQGVDFALIQATPAGALHRVQRIALEVRASHCAPLYERQPICEKVVASMRRLGFRNESACPQQSTAKFWWRHPNCERGIVFARSGHAY